ncbi:hypothetical protein BS47DRAFT_1362474 [Hydnum rufescens UP504]|uniref:DUF4219 domain-containing protein n=1 Tax=Hydnum rufescens UP504 TaxID=1448309 RepID=A0A9P6AX11_9AGAM|nr:hypothetical protein BS47DRAFT_1362474 [Hydnum rufescens UP504]
MDSQPSSESTKFEHMNDCNYFQWKYCMEMQLVWKDLWDVVSGESTWPDGPNTSCAVKNWEKQNCLAAAEIMLHIGKLQLLHEGASWACHIFLFWKFFTTKFTLAEYSLQTHLNNMEEIADHLVSMGIPISKEFCYHLPLCLPPI